MSESDGTFRTGNPFPSSPAVQLRVLAHDGQIGEPTFDPPVSVGTRAHATLRRQVDEYLDGSEEPTGRGRALALIGGLGLGKSHLAREVATEVRARNSGIPLWVIDQPSMDMGRVYRNQLTALYDDRNARDAFESVVAEFHAHVTAEAIEADTPNWLDEQTRQDFIRQLHNNELDSEKVVQSFGIDEELIHRHLRTRLRENTDHRQFSAALALLLDRRFNLHVWNWLTGRKPAQALVERGINAQIDGTDGVFDALTVFGFLHGQVGRPYVLVVDALEEVLEWPALERSVFLNGFERLVNTYVNRGGLLVLCIQPEPWSRLSPGLHERILQIWPDRMTSQETAELVGAYLSRRHPERARPGDPGALFTAPALEELTEIGTGVPRQILKTCRQAWQLMENPRETRSVIDDTVIHDATRQLNEQRSMSDVHAVVERVLGEAQWRRESRPEEAVRAADPVLENVAYWVRVGREAAIAILVVPSILVRAEVLGIAAVARAARGAFPADSCQTLVLVNGLVSRSKRDDVAQYTGTAPLLVGDPDFTRLLDQAVELLAKRLESARQGSQASDVWERLQTMAAQQATLLASIREVDAKLGDDVRPVQAQRDTVEAAVDQVLPETVRADFAGAHAALDVLAGPPGEIARVFTVDGSGRAGTRPRRLAFGQRQLASLGLVAAVDGLLRAFRDGVADWRRAVAERTGGLSQELRDSLFVLCRSFEISMEVLPPFETGAGPADSADFTTRTTTAIHRAEAQETLNRLAESVRTDLLAATEGVTGNQAPPAAR